MAARPMLYPLNGYSISERLTPERTVLEIREVAKLPLLSANVSAGTPILSIIATCRFASGVSFGYFT